MKHNAIRILCIILALASLTAFSSCAGGEENETSEQEITTMAEVTSEEKKWDGTLTLCSGGETSFTIIRDDDADEFEVKSVVSFKKIMNEALGADYPIAIDWVKGGEKVIVNSEPEILLGITNRKESADLLEQIGYCGYGMALTENKLVIAATDAATLALAVEKFRTEIVENPAKYKDGKLVVSLEDCYMEKMERPFQLSDAISKKIPYTVTLTQVIEAKAIGDYCVGQGAASDGTYAYFVLRTVEDGDAKIAKYNLKTGKFVAASEPVHVFHGNDMTYCKSRNLLVLIHGSTEGRIVTLMDPDTLTVVTQSQSIPQGAGAMSYSVERDWFAGSQGGTSLYFLKSDFTMIKSFSKTTTSGYTAQGMGSDEKYVYFPMSGKTDNILMTYDWSGDYVTDVHLPITLESESMFWVNDTYYVNFYKSRAGARLYRLDVYPDY